MFFSKTVSSSEQKKNGEVYPANSYDQKLGITFFKDPIHKKPQAPASKTPSLSCSSSSSLSSSSSKNSRSVSNPSSINIKRNSSLSSSPKEADKSFVIEAPDTPKKKVNYQTFLKKANRIKRNSIVNPV